MNRRQLIRMFSLFRLPAHMADAMVDAYLDMDLFCHDTPKKEGFKMKDAPVVHNQTNTVAKKEPFKRLNRRMGRM